ncbi:hypothetical protein OAX78_00655 [Planctomycetota bacterium]|nr:hypothetical protein [Planctomycetota bacterium]
MHSSLWRILCLNPYDHEAARMWVHFAFTTGHGALQLYHVNRDHVDVFRALTEHVLRSYPTVNETLTNRTLRALANAPPVGVVTHALGV